MSSSVISCEGTLAGRLQKVMGVKRSRGKGPRLSSSGEEEEEVLGTKRATGWVGGGVGCRLKRKDSSSEQAEESERESSEEVDVPPRGQEGQKESSKEEGKGSLTRMISDQSVELMNDSR